MIYFDKTSLTKLFNSYLIWYNSPKYREMWNMSENK